MRVRACPRLQMRAICSHTNGKATPRSVRMPACSWRRAWPPGMLGCCAKLTICSRVPRNGTHARASSKCRTPKFGLTSLKLARAASAPEMSYEGTPSKGPEAIIRRCACSRHDPNAKLNLETHCSWHNCPKSRCAHFGARCSQPNAQANERLIGKDARGPEKAHPTTTTHPPSHTSDRPTNRSPACLRIHASSHHPSATASPSPLYAHMPTHATLKATPRRMLRRRRSAWVAGANRMV